MGFYEACCSLPIIDRLEVVQDTSVTIWKSPDFETREEALAYLSLEVADARRRLKNVSFEVDIS
jgi:hypothetical protein